MTEEQFQQRCCHGNALCSLPGNEQEPPIIIHWTAMHLPPDARACSVRFGAMSCFTVSALHVSCH